MKKLMMMGAAAALSLSVASAFATQNDGGFYVGVKGGYNNMDVPTGSTIGGSATVTGKKDKYVANIHAGYLWPVADQFQLGAQIGYSYFGKYKLTNTTGGKADIKLSSLNLLAVGQYNIEQWFVQGRVGGGYVHESASGNVAGTDGEVDNKWLVVAGASVGYYFTENFSGQIFYDHYFGQDITNSKLANGSANNKPPTMNSVGIGIAYSF